MKWLVDASYSWPVSRDRRRRLVGAVLGATMIAALAPLGAPDASASFFQGAAPELGVTKTGPAGAVLIGNSVPYTLTVTNTGGPATSVVVTDTLPPNVTFNNATFTSGSGTCSAAGQVVTCNVASIPGGGSVGITLNTTLNTVAGTQAVPLPTSPSQIAAAGATTGASYRSGAWPTNRSDLGPVIDVTASAGSVTGPAAVTFTPTGAFGTVNAYNDPYGLGAWTGDQSLEMTFTWDTSPEGPTTAATGDAGSAILTFTFTEPVTNPVLHIDRLGGIGQSGGPVIANSSRLTLLDGLTLTELSGTPQFNTTATTIERQSGGTTVNTGECGATVSTGTQCGTVQISGTVTTVRFLLNAAPGTIEGAGADGIEFIWDIRPAADLAVTKTASDIIHLGGDNFSFTVTATNNGPNTATGVTVTDTLPAGVTLISSTPAAGTTFANPTWTIGSIPSGQSRSLTLNMSVPGGVTEGLFENVARIQGELSDAVLANNVAVAPVYTCPAGTFSNIVAVRSAATQESDISNNYDQACTRVGASVTVAKVTTNGTGSFSFTQTNLSSAVGPLVTSAAGTAVATARIPVTTLDQQVTVTETIPGGWNLQSATCSDRNAAITGNGGTFGNLSGGQLTIPAAFVEAGADIICTFTNALIPIIDLAKTAGAVTAGSFSSGTYTVTYNVVASNTGGGAGVYSFVDTPTAPAGMTVSSVTLSTTDPTVTTAPANGTASASVTNEPIAPNSTETWRTTVVYTITNPSLVVGGSATCNEATGVGGFSNAITGDTNAANNRACVDVPADPTLTIDKPAPVNGDQDGSGDVSVGDTLTYTITTTNTGPSTLTGVVVSDDLITQTGGTTPCASVPHAGTCTLIGTYVVTAADVAAGEIVNEATADSVETTPVTDTVTVPVPAPALSIDKAAPVLSNDADGSGDISAGDTLRYTITATNVGAATLTDLVVSDDLIARTGGTSPCATVAPGGTCTLIGTYVVTATDVSNGEVVNTATADSDQTPPLDDTRTTPLPAPVLTIVKPAPINADQDGSGDVSVGDTLTYTITATNSGLATLTDVVVSDDLITRTGGTSPCATVAPGGTCTLIGTYVVTAGDVTAGEIVNVATADSDQTPPVTDTVTVPVPNPALTIVKPAPINADQDGSGDVSVGDTLTYTITATNSGSATLTDVVVSDDLITRTGGTSPCATVAPGGTCTLIGTYVVTAGDVTAGEIVNVATADSDQTPPVTDTVTVPVPNPALTIVKPAPINADQDGSGDVSVGDTLTYTITATNSGSATLTDVVVSDDLITRTGGTSPCATVAPGGTCTLIGTYVVTAGDVTAGEIVNVATADSDQTPPVTDTVTVPVPNPALLLDKAEPVNADEDGSGDVSVGDTFTYTITATNTGSATLTDLTVVDDLITRTGRDRALCDGRSRWHLHPDRDVRHHGRRCGGRRDRERGDRRFGADAAGHGHGDRAGADARVDGQQAGTDQRRRRRFGRCVGRRHVDLHDHRQKQRRGDADQRNRGRRSDHQNRWDRALRHRRLWWYLHADRHLCGDRGRCHRGLDRERGDRRFGADAARDRHGDRAGAEPSFDDRQAGSFERG